MDKIRKANTIRKKEGYWSLIWKTLRFINYQIEKKAQENIDRPHYRFCANLAGKQAERLGINRISLIEFGVAGGSGLVALEKHVSRLEEKYDVTYEIYGFDTGEGLPEPENHADFPYYWDRAHYDMDVELLRSELDRSTLVLGDVKETIPSFVSDYDPAPIGAIYVDLDYYSSTRDALEILNVEDSNILPRVPIYFDDILGGQNLRMTIPEIGESKAIEEYNKSSKQEKIGKLQFSRSHSEKIRPKRQFAYHRFKHKMYTEYIGKGDRQLPLRIDD